MAGILGVNRKRCLTTVLVLATLLSAGAVSAQEQGRQFAGNQILPNLHVDVVLVNATVTDGRGRYVVGLDKKDFQIWEDKVEQKIEYFSSEDVPMSVGVIFDISGSMKDKIKHARNAAMAFLKMGNADDEYFLMQFSDRPSIVEDFTTDVSRLQPRLEVTSAKGMTALYDAVYFGLNKLKQANKSRKKALLLITDGEDNRSRYTFSDVRDYVKEQDVMLFAIGIVDGAGSQLGVGRTGRATIEELTDLTGGYAFFPESVLDLERDCERIATELKNQYVMGYYSANTVNDGQWRRIRVKVNPPKELPVRTLSVRAKQGYYASYDAPASRPAPSPSPDEGTRGGARGSR